MDKRDRFSFVLFLIIIKNYLQNQEKNGNIYMVDLKKTPFRGNFLNLFLFLIKKEKKDEAGI